MDNFYALTYSQREWMAKNAWRCQDLEINYDPKLELTITRALSSEAFPDPASNEFDIQLLTKGHIHVDHLDCGFGRDAGPFAPGSWTARPSGAPLNIWGSGDFEVVTVSFPWQRLAEDIHQETGQDVTHLGRVHQTMKHDAHVEALIAQLWHDRHADPLHKDSLVTVLVQRLWQLSALERSSSSGREAKGRLDKARLRRVLDSLHSQFLDPLSLNEIAKIVGLSPYHFLRAFKESTGLTPHAYLRRLRVNHGKQLLEKGYRCIDAAYAAGFADQAHFTRTFKSFYRVTPTQYLLQATP